MARERVVDHRNRKCIRVVSRREGAASDHIDIHRLEESIVDAVGPDRRPGLSGQKLLPLEEDGRELKRLHRHRRCERCRTRARQRASSLDEVGEELFRFSLGVTSLARTDIGLRHVRDAEPRPRDQLAMEHLHRKHRDRE